MKTFTIAFLSCFSIQTSYLLAQAPALQWQKSFGGSDNDFAFSVQQTSDGGYIVAGETASNSGDVNGNHGDEDFWVIKLDAKGNLVWQKPLGGFGDEAAFAVEQTTDGGYILAGQANSSSGNVTGNHGNLDFWVVKLDGNGNLTWEKSLGGSNSDYATCIHQTEDGGYIVGGSSFSNDGDVTGHHGLIFFNDYWIVKLDASGNLEWENSYGGSAGEAAFSITQTKDGGYIAAGNSESDDGDVTGMHDITYGDFWVIKLGTSGELQWEKAFGGNDYDQANSIQQTKDGGYIIGGFSRSNDGDITNNHGNYDMWVVKTDKDGNLTWQKSLGGSNGDFGYSIQQTPDNGYVVNGGTDSNNGDVTGNHGNEDFWVVKLSASGNLMWQSALGGSSYDEGKSIDQTSDGGYIAAGFSSSNNGNVSGNHGQNDFWVAKLFSCNCIPPIEGLDASNVSSTSAKVEWDTVGCVIGYKVQYRVIGTTAWTTKKVNGNIGFKKLTGLAPSTTYQWKVSSHCSASSFSSFSGLQTFTTDPLRVDLNTVLITTPINFSVFPNPASNGLWLKIETEENKAGLQLYDVMGKVIMVRNLNKETGDYEQQLDISTLPPGVYYLTVTSAKSNNILSTQKFVKE